MLVGLCVLLALAAARAGEPPPKGPPWLRELGEAQSDALKHRRPLFIYFTKTH